MKISVLLNNYNYGRYIGAAIESVLNQTSHKFELIIVDDGSTDNSRDIIAKYTDPRIVTVFKKNGGQGSAFRAGLSKASGEYIAFLDADDVWDANKLEKCIQIFSSEPDIVLLNHSYRQIDEKGAVIGESHRFRTSGPYDLLSDVRRLDVNFSLVPTSFFIGRRKECLQVTFDESQWKIGADTPVVVGLGLRGVIFNLAETLGSYRKHGNNLWIGRYNNKILFEHFQKFYRFVNEEMKRLGKSERFNFANSESAIIYRILETNRYSPRGIYYRLRKFFLFRQHSRGR